MSTVSKRELNQNTAGVLQQASDSGEVIVTERGTPRWRLSVITPGESPLARMELEGSYTPPVPGPAPWPAHPGGPAYTDTEADALLDDMRGEH